MAYYGITYRLQSAARWQPDEEFAGNADGVAAICHADIGKRYITATMMRTPAILAICPAPAR
ncbi:hypothetical protein JHU04_002966 [Brenneria sp. 4F2]|nr:hypothetical protein [Brenneria bubanii]